MKKTFLFTLAATLLLTGCSNPDIAALKAENTKLRKDIDALREGHDALLEALSNHYKRAEELAGNMARATEAKLVSDQQFASIVDSQLVDLEARVILLERRTNYVVLNARPAPLPTYHDYQRPAGRTQVSQRSSRNASEPLQNGIPADVFQRIKASAEAEYPGDFSLQEYETRLEVEAWKKLNPR